MELFIRLLADSRTLLVDHHRLKPDDDYLDGITALGSVGIFAEPAGAAAFAGLIKAIQQGIISEDDPVIVINTGSGLKDIKAAMQAAGQAPIIEPKLDAVRKVLGL